MRTLLRMFWMFIPLNLLTQPRPQTLEEAWRESWGSWSEERSFTPHRVRIQDDSWLWPPLCRLPLATCLNRPHRRLQRKGVNCKPFHANFETHFLHTHHSRSTKIIHGIYSIYSDIQPGHDPIQIRTRKDSNLVPLLFLSSSPPAQDFGLIHTNP